MSFTSKVREVGVGLHALEAIGKLAKGMAPPGAQGRAEQAVGIVSLITKIYDAVAGGLATGAGVGDIEIEIKRLTDSDLETDVAVREAIDGKFPQK